MEISILGCIVGLLMAIVPVYLLEKNGVKFLFKILRSLIKMVIFLGITGGFLYFVFKWNIVYVNVLFVLLMMSFGTLMTIIKSRLELSRYLLPVFVGVFLSTVLVSSCIIFAIKGFSKVTDANMLIPVFALLIWAIVETNAPALRTYCMGLRHHGQLYEYLLGNGATHRQAVQYFIKRAFERVSIPYIRRMALVVIGSSPIVVWCLLLYGVDVWTAIIFQALVFIGTFCASVLSLYLSLLVADKFSFDKYGNFKDNIKLEKEEDV